MAQAVWSEIDTDGDGDPSPAEQDRHARALASNLLLQVNGRPVAWKVEQFVYPGHDELFSGGLAAVRLRLAAPLPAGAVALTVRDLTYPQFTAVFPEPVIEAAGGTVRGREILDDGRQVRFTFEAGPGRGSPGASGAAATSETER